MTWPPPIVLPEEFNAAVYFVDRHLREDRSEKIAIECEDGRASITAAAGCAGVCFLFLRDHQDWRSCCSRQHSAQVSGLQVSSQQLAGEGGDRGRVAASAGAGDLPRGTSISRNDCGSRYSPCSDVGAGGSVK